MDYTNKTKGYANSIKNTVKLGLAVAGIAATLTSSGLANTLPYNTNETENKKQTLESVLSDNMVRFNKSDLQYIGAADRYAEIWKKEVEKTGNKELIERYNSHLSDLNKFKEDTKLSHEAWIESYNGNISDLVVYPEQDFVSFKTEKSDSYTLNMFKRDIKLDAKFKEHIVKESKFFYDMFFELSNEYKQDINNKTENTTLQSVLKDIKKQ
ncbi:MAG: hypothetical protein PHV16_01370 [Candidatus Nanoarchaeia archaeon]|nr:hypothetical protein [Candidatus Nanoarchaeia archaeon]